jgi:hypothetical protein
LQGLRDIATIYLCNRTIVDPEMCTVRSDMQGDAYYDSLPAVCNRKDFTSIQQSRTTLDSEFIGQRRGPLEYRPITNRRYRSATKATHLTQPQVASAYAFATVCGTEARTLMTHLTHKSVDRYSEEWFYRSLTPLHSHKIRITLG